MKKIAIDLLWVKPNKTGGTESFIRNLLLGIMEIEINFDICLITTKDNFKTFEKYLDNSKFQSIVCSINSVPVSKRIIWQNIFFEKVLRENNIKYCFSPVYLKPIRASKDISYITLIHDLQHLHYPEYFSKIKNYWMTYSWKRAIKTSKRVVTISDYVREDICSFYKISNEEIKVIYDPIVIDNGYVEFEKLAQKYKIEREQYYFTLSSLLKHKNVEILLKIIETIKNRKINLPVKLIIAGISGSEKLNLQNYIERHGLEKNCLLTGFISNEERNSLYKYSAAFLFPSVFEGFGMPVVEGLMLGTHVVTTSKTSIPEVSCGLAEYVEDPYSVEEWIDKLLKAKDKEKKEHKFPQYDRNYIAQQYITLFNEEFH